MKLKSDSKCYAVILFKNTSFHDTLMLFTVIVGSYILAASADIIKKEGCSCQKKDGRESISLSSHDFGNDYSDLITDPVREQYRSFPYPYVGNDMIQLEKDYYNSSKRDIPLVTYDSSSLEYINHFLYEGNNDFK